MTCLLHVNCSPRSAHSQSLSVAEDFLLALRERQSDIDVDTLNLFDDPLPDFGVDAAEAKISTFFGQEQSAEQAAAWSIAREVFDRFAAADGYLFNIPMWNHGLPYRLKQWIDIITQPGWAFGFDPSVGYNGLLKDKKAVVVYTCGVYQPGRPPAFGADFLTTYFEDWLTFVGIEDRKSISLFGQVVSPDAAAEAALARQRARELAAAF